MSDGLWTPPSVDRSARPSSVSMPGLSRRATSAADLPEHDGAIAEMRKNRSVNRRSAAASGVGGSELSFATMRPRDPMFYWKSNNLPYDIKKPGELERVRAYCRLLYLTHPLIASAVDIYSRYPLTGMELQCKDQSIAEFHNELFMEQLDYEEYLPMVLREYWVSGEANVLGSFNDLLGVWEDDELINADDVEVHRSPFFKEPRLFMKLPEYIREIIKSRQPAHEFAALMQGYPELANFQNDDAMMPVSNVLLKQLQFKADVFHPRGVPILLRGLRAVMQEEMMNAAQDAIADRLYTPLLLAKLGASAQDLGTSQPWIPSPDDLMEFEEALDAALAADFRVMTHHFATDISSVFGREQMPRLGDDFERLAERQLQVFGLSKTMLSGASGGQTYAADALNRDLVTQLLKGAQRLIKRLFRDRALVVAEAQEHYDYEERSGKRYVRMEEVLEVDEETGERRIVEQPKLLVPDLNIAAMNMRDDEQMRMFIEAAAASGIPISMTSRLTNIPFDMEDEIDKVISEQVDLAVQAQEVRKQTYEALRAKGLPIPADLITDFEPKAMEANQGTPASAESAEPVPTLGLVEPAPTDALNQYHTEDAAASDATGANVVALPRNQMGQRPVESDEQRRDMPKASKMLRDKEGKTSLQEVDGVPSFASGPAHVGMRRQAVEQGWLDPSRPLNGEDDEDDEEIV